MYLQSWRPYNSQRILEIWNRFIASGLLLFSSGSKAFKLVRVRAYIKRRPMIYHLFLENTCVPTSSPSPSGCIHACSPFPQPRCAPASVWIDVTCPSHVLPYKQPRPQNTVVKASLESWAEEPGEPSTLRARAATHVCPQPPSVLPKKTSLSMTIQNKSETLFHLLGPFI